MLNSLGSQFHRALLVASALALSWLWMQIVHELGHCLHAWFSGGTVERVVLHPLVISRTDLAINPHPLFVAWGGALWGVALPLAAWGAAARVLQWRGSFVLRFFAGFCLVANGAYLAVDAFEQGGDGGDIVALGQPRWILIAFGIATIPAGLFLWHGEGPRWGIGPHAEPVKLWLAWSVAAMLIATIVVECATFAE